MYFTGKQKLFMGGATLLAVLFVVGSYFGSHWYYGDVAPLPEHLLTDEPFYSRVNQETPVSVSQNAELLESSSVSEAEESFGDDVVSTAVSDKTENESLFVELVDPLSPETRDFPEVPDDFPWTPIWLRVPGYQKGDSYRHELIYRVLIKLWNQGDRDFVNGIYSHDYNKVYPLYPDVMYVEWEEEEVAGPDGPLTIQVISGGLGTETRFFTPTDFITGAWETKYPGVELIDMETAGIDPETFLSDNE